MKITEAKNGYTLDFGKGRKEKVKTLEFLTHLLKRKNIKIAVTKKSMRWL